MQTFNDFERAELQALKRQEDIDLACVACKCGCQWFEEKTFYRFAANHNLILGQEIPKRPGSLGYQFLCCIKCGNIIQPNVQHYQRDLSADDYDVLLDVLEDRETPRLGATIGEIQTEKL